MSMSSLVEIRDLLATERVKQIQKHDTYILDWNTGYVCSDLVTSLLQVVKRRDKLIVKTSSVCKLNAVRVEQPSMVLLVPFCSSFCVHILLYLIIFVCSKLY